MIKLTSFSTKFRQFRLFSSALLLGYLTCHQGFAQALFDHGTPHIYSGTALGAIQIPVGGIGAGTIRMNGNATRDNSWWIWGEWEINPMKTMPNSFFAIRTQVGTAPAVVRALQTVNQGNWSKMTDLTFKGEYPFGWYDFVEPALPVKVSLEVFNPLIPLDAKNSAIPCAVYSYTVENTSAQTVKVNLLGTQMNPIGTGVLSGYGANINSVLRTNGSTILSMRSQIPTTEHYFGNMALMAFQQSTASATASWSTQDALLADFTANGTLAGADSVGPSTAGQTLQGALSSEATLAPGQKTTLTYVLTWYFPNRRMNWSPNPVGPKYSTWWSSALDVANYCNANLLDFTAKTKLFNKTFYSSNLPYWMLDGAANNFAIMRSPTVFWNKDGFLGVNEGWRTDGHQDGNCTHVVHYAQGHAYLFPDLARTIREGVFNNQYKTTGAINFRIWESHPATDGQFAEILSIYREHLHNVDGTWLSQMWPKAKKAMEYSITTWDLNEDGVLSGSQWNTLDGNINGNNTWIGSLYLAALAATEKMATLQGDAAMAARCAQIRTRGKSLQDLALFNTQLGYFIQIPDKPGTDQAYGNGSEIDQLLGQYWSNLLGLGELYPKAHIRSALQKLYTNNFQTSFVGYNFQGQRHFVSPNDAGLVMCTWPTGSTKPPNPLGYYAESMTGFEYGAAVAMMQTGLLTEGFTVFKAVRDRYNGVVRPEWDWPGGDPFREVEWGSYYFRALAAWSAIPATQGYAYDGPANAIAFHPVFKPDNHVSFFMGSEGYGLFSQARTAMNQMDTIAVKSGKLTLKQLDFYLDSLAAPKNVVVKNNGVTLSPTVTFGTTDGNIHLAFATPITLSAGDIFTVYTGTPSNVKHSVAMHNDVQAFKLQEIDGGLRLILPNEGKSPITVTLQDLSGKTIALYPKSVAGAGKSNKTTWDYGFSASQTVLQKGVYLAIVKMHDATWKTKIWLGQ